MRDKIKVFVWRGCVESVWTTTPTNKTEVEVLDKDADPERAAEVQGELEKNCANVGEWSQMWP